MSSNGTALAAGGVTPCCSATTLLAAAAASFAFSFLLVMVFLFLRFLLLRRRWRRSARLPPLEQPRPKLGLDAAAIAMLPSFPYRRPAADADAECSTTSAAAECAVCLGALDEGQTVRRLPGCDHVFHQECIDVWLASRASCPICRRKADEPARAEDRAAASASARVAAAEMLEDEIVASSSTPEEAGTSLWTRPGAGSAMV
ncbi:hypothetical protein ACP70R_030925 [Stipagrostis hirtigluma subsp. patula]